MSALLLAACAARQRSDFQDPRAASHGGLPTSDGQELWQGGAAIGGAAIIATEQALRGDPAASGGPLCGGEDPSPAHTCPLVEPKAP